MKAKFKFDFLNSKLKEIYSDKEARNIAIYFFEEILNINKTDLFLSKELELTSSQSELYEYSLKLLITGMPVQYLKGECTFMDTKLKLTPDVLIPRPETEELIMLAVNSQLPEKPSILDIGTGSGCIAISLKKLIPLSNITAIDISEKAIEIAKYNANLNKVEINFINLDMKDLKHLPLNKKMDCIISNPPYISVDEKEFLHKNVIEFEPAIALFTPDKDPLYYYKIILNSIPYILKKGGLVLFEINENSANDISNLLKQKNFKNVKVINDFHDKERFITAFF